MDVSIIVATWQNSGITKRCYESLFREISPGMELVWVDNGSDERHFRDVYDFIGGLGKMGQTVVIRNRQNLGFVRANNQGIKASGGGVVVLLNNDTELYEGSLSRLLAHLGRFDMVCPVSNNSASTRPVVLKRSIPDFPQIEAQEYRKYYRLIQSKYAGKGMRMNFVPFFCVAIKRGVFGKVGMLDERFLYGYAEDRDYCMRAEDAGVKIGAALDTFVFHEMAKTFAILRVNMRDYWTQVQTLLEQKYPERKVYRNPRRKQ
jgi:GT2 family glycosyltransferase